MTWWAMDVVPEGTRRDEVASWLVATTGQAIEERPDGTLVGFAPDDAEAERLRLGLQQRFGQDVRVQFRPLEATDWTVRWRDGLGPRRVGRVTLLPTWGTPPEDTGIVVTIDPEMAFGSGEHGSTRAALALLDRHVRPGDLVLDLGSGSGILAIAAVRLGARRAIGIEVDPEAMPVALRNADRNGVAAQVTFIEGDAGLLAPLAGPARVIVSNILRGPNIELLPAIAGALADDGVAIFSGMERPEAELFRPALAAAGFRALDEVVDEAWWSVAAGRPC